LYKGTGKKEREKAKTPCKMEIDSVTCKESAIRAKEKRIVPHYIEDCPEWISPSGAWGIRGMSKGSYFTGFVCTGILSKLCLDIGVHTHITPRAILLTHTHTDHFSAFADTVLYCGNPIPVYCPAAAVLPVKTALVGDASVSECTPTPKMGSEGIPQRYNVKFCPLDPGEARIVDGLLSVTAIGMAHTVPCIGYAICERRKKLRTEFSQLGPAEICDRKKQGIEINACIEVPLVLFFGDTEVSAVALAMQKYRDVPVAIVECTWLESVPESSSLLGESEGGGHCAWTGGLESVVEEHQKTTFVLIHFSARYTEAKIVEYLTKSASASGVYENVVMWLESGPISMREALGKKLR
jgi:ribonuclease BN (tRNA processing enzyme)